MSKILILTSAHPVFDVRIFHKQARALVKAGYSVVLIAQCARDETVDGVRIVSLPKPHNRLQRMLWLTFRVLRLALKEKANVYHFHDPELIPIGVILKIFGRKVIYDVHEDYPKSILTKHYLPKFSRRFLSFTLNFIEKSAARFFDLIVAATDSIQQNFSNYCRSTVIHNYPHVPDSAVTEKEQDSFFKIIYPGPLCEIRGITQILEAIELIGRSSIKLVLIGRFVTADFENYVKSLKIWDKVEYMGVLSHEDVMKNLVEADLGIECSLPTPNYLYAESNKIFEYMAVGLPVLCSNLPGMQKIVEGNKCGICINPLNIQKIANGIEYLMANPDLREGMGQNGRRAVLEKYDWEKEEKKLLKVYAKVLSGT